MKKSLKIVLVGLSLGVSPILTSFSPTDAVAEEAGSELCFYCTSYAGSEGVYVHEDIFVMGYNDKKGNKHIGVTHGNCGMHIGYTAP